MTIPLLSLLFGGAVVFVVLYRHSLRSRTRRIQQFVFPSTIAAKVIAAYPHLSSAQAALVMDGLREYFLISLMANRRMVSMPSKVVDVAWHEFILFTKNYQQFCRSAFGRFLHHTPSEAMQTPTQAQEGIKRAWRLSCKRQGIDPVTPQALPLLFAIDGLLAIPNGFMYTLNCQSNSGYCASHIGCSSGCGGGCGGSSSAGSCSSSAGDGDGGGGGCGGGD